MLIFLLAWELEFTLEGKTKLLKEGEGASSVHRRSTEPGLLANPSRDWTHGTLGGRIIDSHSAVVFASPEGGSTFRM